MLIVCFEKEVIHPNLFIMQGVITLKTPVNAYNSRGLDELHLGDLHGSETFRLVLIELYRYHDEIMAPKPN